MTRLNIIKTDNYKPPRDIETGELLEGEVLTQVSQLGHCDRIVTAEQRRNLPTRAPVQIVMEGKMAQEKVNPHHHNSVPGRTASPPPAAPAAQPAVSYPPVTPDVIETTILPAPAGESTPDIPDVIVQLQLSEQFQTKIVCHELLLRDNFLVTVTDMPYVPNAPEISISAPWIPAEFDWLDVHYSVFLRETGIHYSHGGFSYHAYYLKSRDGQ